MVSVAPCLPCSSSPYIFIVSMKIIACLNSESTQCCLPIPLFPLQAYELSTLTGTQVMLLVASETGHVYTFATRKLQPMITSDAGKALIQTCLNSPDSVANGGPDVMTTNGHLSVNVTGTGGNASSASATPSPSLNSQSSSTALHHQHQQLHSHEMANQGQDRLDSMHRACTSTPTTDQRMSATGYEETDLSYSVLSADDCSSLNDKVSA